MNPQEQPQMPQPPVSPQPQLMQTQDYQGAPMVPMQPKNSKKGLIIGLIVGGVVLLLAAVGVVLWLTMFNISAADYKKAQTATGDVKTAYSTLQDDYSKYMTAVMSGSSSASSAKSSLDKSYSDYKSKVDELKNLKALGNSAIKKSYDSFMSDHQKVTSVVDDTLASNDTLDSISTSCSSSKASGMDYSNKATIVSSYDSVLEQCIKDLETLSKAKQTDIAGYAKKLYDLYKEQRSYFQDLQDAYIAKDQTKYDEAVNNISDQVSKFTGTSSDAQNLVQSLQDKSKSADGSLTSLDNAINEKVK